MNLHERYLQMANRGYGDEYDEDYDEDVDIDIEGAKRRKKRKTTKKKKKGGCCGAGGMEGGASYKSMQKAIAAHNRKAGTKKYQVIGLTKSEIKRIYNKIKGKRGGAPVTRNKDLNEAYDLIMRSVPFNTGDNVRLIKNIKASWPVGDQEDFINAVLSGRIKTTQGLKRYADENAPLENIFEAPFEDEVLDKNIRCNTNKETMDLCRRLSRLEREYEKEHRRKVSKSAFL